jgi:hypothetical protein
VVRSAGVLGLAVLLCACAQRGGGTSPDALDPGLPEAPDALVLQVAYTGGFVTPEMLAARLPLVSVYADGRVVSEGPVIAIYPAPAWPNVQVQQVGRTGVGTLVELARDAGATATADLGEPPLADVPSTRFTLATAEGTSVREVASLVEGPVPGLTAEQQAARSELLGLVDALTDLPGTLGPDAVETAAPYQPSAVAAVVRPWTAADADAAPDLPQPDAEWPGPALPGEPLGPLPDLSCVTATGEEARALAAAAREATGLTPWVTDDGARWAVTFRPLLPHESGCADLAG